MKSLLGLACALLCGPVALAQGEVETAGSRTATLVVLEGAIGPATSQYVRHALEDAAESHSAVVILQLDTPGGLDSSMRGIIKGILASPVPVIAYVAPSGARAASAGTYILYAAHLAAMAPATNLGAATPVSIGGESSPPAPTDIPGSKPSKEKGKGQAADEGKGEPQDKGTPANPMARKATNDAVAYIRSLAQLRGRNADWAEAAVRSAASLSATEALKQNVIEIIAKDVPDLLAQAQGRKLKAADQQLTLDTRDLVVKRVEPDWRTQLLSVLTNPTIAYGLLLIGIYGLLLEGYNPGAILPGVAGAISLLLALYGFELLSVNYAGLALIVLGVGLMITEFFVPAFGSLVIGGLVAFVIGSVILFDNDVPGLHVARPLIAGIAIAGGLVALTIVALATRAFRRPVRTGTEEMIGASAEALGDFAATGIVLFDGERWNARTAVPLRSGQRVRVTAVDGLVLTVAPED